MTDSTTQITALLSEIDGTPHGATERALIDQAIALADEAGEAELAYQARMRLVGAAHMTGDTDAMLSSFVWCVGMNESDPQRFPTAFSAGLDLLWFYKWMPATLAASTLFPLEEIDRVLDQMTERFRREGVGMGAVVQARFDVADITGRLEEAERRRVELKNTPRDDYSHCEACVRSAEGSFLASIGREAEALVLFDEMFEQNLSCGDEPEAALGRALLPLLRAGRLEDAKAAHLRSYRLAKNAADNIGIVANHLLFCAVTGNESRGLTLLEKHIGWLAHDGLDGDSHFSALRAVGVLLNAIDAAGLGTTVVRGAATAELVPFFGEHEGQWSVHDLAAAAWTAATALAARFDERNGNDHYTDLVRSAQKLSEEHYEVPLDVTSFVQLPVIAQPRPADAAGWLAHARELMGAGLFDEAVAAARSGLALDPDAEQRSALDVVIIQMFCATGRQDEAIAAIADRGTALRALGRSEQTEVEQSLGVLLFGAAEESDLPRLLEALEGAQAPDVRADIAVTAGALLSQLDRDEEARPLLQRSLDDAAAAGVPELIQTVMQFSMHIYASLGEFDEAYGMADTLLEQSLNRSQRATTLSVRSRLHMTRGEGEAGLADAEAAFALAAELGARPMLIDFGILSASILSDLDLDQQSANRWRIVVREAELAERPDITGLRFSFARQLVHAGNADEAAEILEELKEFEEHSGATAGERAETLFWLGLAYRLTEELSFAYSQWREAIDLYEEFPDFAGAARAGLELGNMLLAFEDSDALELYEHALENARKVPEQAELMLDVLHIFGQAKSRHGDAAGLELLTEAMTIAKENDQDWLVADLTDSRARCLHLLDRVAEAIPVGLEAADLYLAAGSTVDSGNAEFFVARLLAGADRATDAAPVFASSLEKLADNPRAFALASLEYGDVLESIGRFEEAASVRAAAS